MHRYFERSASLPDPPTDKEKFDYLGAQKRWLLVVQFAAFAGVAYSFIRFSLQSYLTLLLIAPLGLYAITSLISLRSGTYSRRISSISAHLTFCSRWAIRTAYPSVDVLLPSAGEGLDILANTFKHVARLKWAGELTVYVLDDSARLEVRDLAVEHGFKYLSRPDRGHLKKAGNLLYGYSHSDGDLIAIFDADFVPRADYLYDFAPYFDDSRVGIVQSPQYFSTTRAMNWIERTAGATQELFYRFVQPSRDRVDAAICVGTCGVYRRAALADIGGFAQIGHSEDVHTGVNMLKGGYVVRYVPVIASRGLCPDTISSFATQQYRWCTGSMSLLADVDFHRARAIGLRQRLCFWSGFLYYIGTAVNVFVSPLPLLAMLWFFPELVHPRNSAPLVGAIALWCVVLPMAFRSRWRPEVLRIQTVYGFAHALAIVHILRRSSAEWVPTNSRQSSPLAHQVQRLMFGYLAVTTLATAVALLVAVPKYGAHEFWAVLLFAAFRLYIVVPVMWGSAKTFAVSRVRLAAHSVVRTPA